MLAPKLESCNEDMKAMMSPSKKAYEPHDGKSLDPNLLHVKRGIGPPDQAGAAQAAAPAR